MGIKVLITANGRIIKSMELGIGGSWEYKFEKAS
jgi:hypothetical protein